MELQLLIPFLVHRVNSPEFKYPTFLTRVSSSLHQFNFLNHFSAWNLLFQPSFPSLMEKTSMHKLIRKYILSNKNYPNQRWHYRNYVTHFTLENRNSGKSVLGFTRTSPWSPWTLDIYPTSTDTDSSALSTTTCSWVAEVENIKSNLNALYIQKDFKLINNTPTATWMYPGLINS